MELQLVRIGFTPIATEGVLYIDGTFECYTLEDTVREPGVKVPGRTAIPFGTYEIDVTYSPRFQCLMPILQDVPGFEGIRIHTGNDANATEGCLLVGDEQTSPEDGWIGKSRVAYDRLFGKIQAAKKQGERVRIRIIDGRQLHESIGDSVRPVT